MAVAAIGALAGILLLGPAGTGIPQAHAQSAACPQYNPNCGGNQGVHGGGGGGNPGGTQPTGGGGAAPSGGNAVGPSGGQGGELPFTGYPLTPLILLLLLLLAAGLAIRGYVAARDRLRARHAVASDLPFDIG